MSSLIYRRRPLQTSQNAPAQCPPKDVEAHGLTARMVRYRRSDGNEFWVVRASPFVGEAVWSGVSTAKQILQVLEELSTTPQAAAAKFENAVFIFLASSCTRSKIGRVHHDRLFQVFERWAGRNEIPMGARGIWRDGVRRAGYHFEGEHCVGLVLNEDARERRVARAQEEYQEAVKSPVVRRRRVGADVGCIYFIRDTGSGNIKIGYTSGAPEDRCAQLQTGASALLEVIGAMIGPPRLERVLHDRFVADRVINEWFRPSEGLIRAMARLVGQVARDESDVDDLLATP